MSLVLFGFCHSSGNNLEGNLLVGPLVSDCPSKLVKLSIQIKNWALMCSFETDDSVSGLTGRGRVMQSDKIMSQPCHHFKGNSHAIKGQFIRNLY